MPVRFSLQDIKKQVHRRGDTLYVSIHFLRPGELHPEIERLVNYYEQLLGRPQRDFSIVDASACIGDYRLAHCLVATLSAWYSWRQHDWQEALKRISDDTLARFEEAGIKSPIHLRLALFNYVNEHYCGFLDAELRTQALENFAETFCGEGEQHALSVPDLQYLLALDSDEEALLVRDAPHPPGAGAVAALYNQWAFEAALFNASDVHFAVDCNAFLEMQNASATMSAIGVGAVIKRLCYLSRKLGVYYDLAYDSDLISRQTSPSTLRLTLYGPQEVTGAPQQYGLRLAKLCRILLGYSTPNHPRRGGGGADVGRGPLGRPSLGSMNTLPSSAILEAEATVHFLQRTYTFAMDANLLKLLPLPSETNLIETQLPASSSTNLAETRFIAPSSTLSSNEQAPKQQERNSSLNTHTALSSSIFDSSIEQSFAEAFQALANSDGADGWRLEREPEPLLLSSISVEATSTTTAQGIFIPDFALTRDDLRIYVEILGFWTPAYRERKIAKLHQLKERGNLVLAIPAEARDAFASIATAFPIVYYNGQLSATELLKVLRIRYDNLAERLALIDADSVRKCIESEGLLPERACYRLLHCYRRSELPRAAGYVVGEGIDFTSGIGLYQIDWLEQLRSSFVNWLGEIGRNNLREGGGLMPLPQVLNESRKRWPALAACEDETLEALISLWPEVHITRNSIFEATIEVLDKEGTSFTKQEALQPKVENRPKKSVRERSSTIKKRIIREASQSELWG
jgi:predicted nuclease of restriction endonuclease-like RecB superfamily